MTNNKDPNQKQPGEKPAWNVPLQSRQHVRKGPIDSCKEQATGSTAVTCNKTNPRQKIVDN